MKGLMKNRVVFNFFGLFVSLVIFLSINVEIVTASFDKCDNEDGCCHNKQTFSFNENYTGTKNKALVNLDNGESACTVGLWKTYHIGEFLVSAKLVCKNGNTTIEFRQSLGDICKDGDGNDQAEFVSGVSSIQIDYPDQEIVDKKVSCQPSNYIKQGDEPYPIDEFCKSSTEIARCMHDGEIVVMNRCTGNQKCKMSVYLGENKANCVDPICIDTETGKKATHGESICIRGNDPNEKIPIKKCVISGDFQDTGILCEPDRCSDNNGAAKCLEGDEIECVDDVKGKLAPGSTTCYNNTVWGCINENSEGIFKPGEECTGNTPYCRVDTKSLEIGSSAYCTNRTEEDYTEEEKKHTLFFSITTSNGFWYKEGESINTALGPIPITAQGLVDKLLPTLFGLAGVLSFLMMVFGFIMVATSSGDEKKLQEAKQRITSAIIGLLLSIFALVIYRMIAVNILQIPGIK